MDDLSALVRSLHEVIKILGKCALTMVRKRCPLCGRNVTAEHLEAHFAFHHPEAVDFPTSNDRISTFKEIRTHKKAVVVDGSNILHLKGKRGKLPMGVLIRVIHLLKKNGFNPIAVCSARIKHQIDDPDTYVQLWKAGEILESPAGEDDDLFILETARRLEAAWIVSNDKFANYTADFPGVTGKQMRCSIGADGRIYLAKS